MIRRWRIDPDFLWLPPATVASPAPARLSRAGTPLDASVVSTEFDGLSAVLLSGCYQAECSTGGVRAVLTAPRDWVHTVRNSDSVRVVGLRPLGLEKDLSTPSTRPDSARQSANGERNVAPVVALPASAVRLAMGKEQALESALRAD